MAKAKLEVEIGANNTKAIKGIKEVKKEGVDAVQEIQNKNREAVKNLVGRFALAGVAVGALFKLIGKIGEQITAHFSRGEVFTKWGEKAKISAESVAYLKAQADSAGVSAEEFERSMTDLASGNVTLSQLSERWGQLGDKIKTANKAQENFEQLALARAKNFSLFTKATQDFFGGLAEGALEMVGFGGSELSAIERSAYEGKSYEEAVAEGARSRKSYSLSVSEDRKRRAYDSAVAKKQADEIATKERTMNTSAKKLADADISNTDRERLFKQQTGVELSNEAILALAESLKTNEERFADEIKKATEAEKKRADDDKKQTEKDKKFADEMSKTKLAITDSFTAGGGLIGGAGYSLRNKSGIEAMTAVAEKQLNIQRKQEKTLEDVRAILKGE